MHIKVGVGARGWGWGHLWVGVQVPSDTLAQATPPLKRYTGTRIWLGLKGMDPTLCGPGHIAFIKLLMALRWSGLFGPSV